MTSLKRIVRHMMIAVLLSCGTSVALAMPSTGYAPQMSHSDSESNQAGEPLACLVIDMRTPSQIRLSADQFVEWQNLKQAHNLYFGDRCLNAANSSGTLPASIQTTNAHAIQAYRKDFIEFLSGLTPEQRSLLEDLARTRREARAALEEKTLRHRLML